MATYEYRSKHGKRLLIEAPMTEAPPVGHTIRKGGVVYRRQASALSVKVDKAGRRAADIVAWSQPNKQQMDPALHRYVDGWNKYGKPCFSSTEAAHRYAGATRDKVEKKGHGDFVSYGDGPDGVETEKAHLRREPIKFDR